MKEILVLCLTRFGDLIQTTPLLRGLKNRYPDGRVTLAVQRRFSAVLPLIHGFDRAVVLDKDDVAANVRRGDALEAYRRMDEFITLLEEDRYDLIVNLTCDRMSAYMASSLKANHVSGITTAADGQRVINGMWGTHLFSVMLGENRKYNRINLVDIFVKMSDLQPDGQGVQLHETESGRLFADRFIDEGGVAGERLIGIQLGASESVRCWPAESFAALSDHLQETEGVRTVLFGSPGEKLLADRAMAAMKHAAINSVGRTGIEELFSLVKRCSLLVTNDTGTMHFAAAAGVPVIMLSIGPAFFRSTGPYSSGNLALQPVLPCSPCRYNLTCNDPVCRSILSVDIVHNACRLLMGETIDHSSAFPGVAVYQSYFEPDGFLEWQTLCNGNSEREELTRRYALLWKGIQEGTTSMPRLGQRLTNAHELEQLTARGMQLTAKIRAAVRQAPLPVKLITTLGEQETAVETGIKQIGSSTPEMAPLVDFLTLLRESITSDDLHTIAVQTHDLYTQGHRLAASL